MLLAAGILTAVIYNIKLTWRYLLKKLGPKVAESFEVVLINDIAQKANFYTEKNFSRSRSASAYKTLYFLKYAYLVCNSMLKTKIYKTLIEVYEEEGLMRQMAAKSVLHNYLVSTRDDMISQYTDLRSTLLGSASTNRFEQIDAIESKSDLRKIDMELSTIERNIKPVVEEYVSKLIDYVR